MDLENLTKLEVEIIMLILDEPLADRVIASMKGLYYPQLPPILLELIDSRKSAWEKVRNQYDEQI